MSDVVRWLNSEGPFQGDLHFIRQCFGEQAASVFAAMVVNNTAYCFRCGFK